MTESGRSSDRARESLSPTAADKIRLAVKARGMAQGELAGPLGIEPSGVTALLKGERRASAIQAATIARRIGVSLDWLMDDAKPPAWPPQDGVSIRPEDALVRFIEALGMSPREAIDVILATFDLGGDNIHFVAARDLSSSDGSPPEESLVDVPARPRGRIKRGG